MSSVKLTADSGGGTVELKAPAGTPSDGARVIQLPNGPGVITQVVPLVSSTRFSEDSLTSGEFTSNIVTAAITPSSANSKVWITGALNVSCSLTAPTIGLNIYRGSTNLDDYRAAQVGSNRARFGATIAAPDPTNTMTLHVNHVDSPATTSEVTYGFRIAALFGESSCSLYMNMVTGSDPDEIYGVRNTSQITLMEVSG